MTGLSSNAGGKKAKWLNAARIATVTGPLVALGLAAAYAVDAPAQESYVDDGWWSPGQGGSLPAEVQFKNGEGALGFLNSAGAIDTKDHPFFTALGANGRACISCHQPSDAMSLSTDSIQRRWEQTGGKDPLFAAIDGANCPGLPAADRASHSLLLDRGLFRVATAWPPKTRDGKPFKPEFKIEVVRDPTGCNTSPVYGLNSPNPTISVYRRPRMAANLRFVTFAGGRLNAKNLAMTMPVDPETGKAVGLNFMADARELTLKTQAVNAVLTHEQGAAPPTDAQLQKIVDFESKLFVAQRMHSRGGDLRYAGGPPALGPEAMRDGKVGQLGDIMDSPVFLSFDAWRKSAPGETAEQRAFRASAARGMDVFFLRPFFIRDAQHINTVGLGNPTKRTCATCHNGQLTGQDLTAGWVDLGTTNRPWANESPELPLFKITCDAAAPPHTFLGRVIYTQDPGRALVSGRCLDVGSIVMAQFRGLSARKPYFSNGSAKTLRELVDFYDRRFKIGYSEQERTDLVNFLSVL